MASAAVEKTAEELRKEIAELQRQQWEITERLRNPRGVRRAAASAGGSRIRGVIRPAPESEEQPVSKRRLSSAVVKVDGEESKNDNAEAGDLQVQDTAVEVGASSGGESARLRSGSGQINGGFRRDGNVRLRKMDYDAIPTETVPRVLPKEDDPNLVKRNRRMLGQLLGTLEKFREEDKQLSSTEAYMRRSDSLKRAEQKAREESERLRQQEREQISEKRRRDLTLRARVAAKAEEKKLELLFLLWAEHHKKLSNFLRTKAEPPIYYMPVKPLVEDAAFMSQHKEQDDYPQKNGNLLLIWLSNHFCASFTCRAYKEMNLSFLRRPFKNGSPCEERSCPNTRNRLKRIISLMWTRSSKGGKMQGTRGDRTIWLISRKPWTRSLRHTG
ncbi:pinin isoform X2 [Phalaenopsis equestris]|uniref:pinin isoform X2 n=1 Tax=Phalaenopsis equestris TaxID=78828 RepID=UPI0009E59D60|nr:pinin isoform X2 [Phalaenopsis equestris]